MAASQNAPGAQESLVVDPAVLRNAQRQLNDISEALIQKLRKSGNDVDHLLESWHGGAAVKWSDGWTEVRDSANDLFNILGALSDFLGRAASSYEQQDRSSGQGFTEIHPGGQISWGR